MRSVFRPAAVLLALCGGLLLAGCPGVGGGSVPAPGTNEYRDAVSAFFTGTISLANGGKAMAQSHLMRAVELAPGEPAALANRALLYLIESDLGKAAADLEKAQALAPDNDQILVLTGLLAEKQGKFDVALALYQKAAQKNPRNLKALYMVAVTADRQNAPDKAKVIESALEQILQAVPNNLFALCERMRTAADAGNREGFRAALATVTPRLVNLSPVAQTALAALQKGAATDAPLTLKRRATVLENVLKNHRDYQASRSALTYPNDNPGEPIGRLLKMVNPPATPAAPDNDLKYAVEGLGAGSGVAAFALDAQKAPAVFAWDPTGVRRVEPAGTVAAPAGTVALAAFDLTSVPYHIANDDIKARIAAFKLDLAAVGKGGLKLLKNDGARFVDATAATTLPASTTGAAYTGVWTVDIEADGDLDLILSPASGDPVVLQNNSDSTFTPIKTPFPKVPSPLRAFAWADIDGDGDTDALLADRDGKLHAFANERSGFFVERPAPTDVGKVLALAVAEATGDTTLDVLALEDDGSVKTVADGGDGKDWQAAKALVKSGVAGPNGLFAADLDNNGGVDLIVSGSAGGEVFLSDEKRALGAARPVPIAVRSVVDTDGDGLLDLVGIADGKPAKAQASGSKKYRWQSFSLVTGKTPAPQTDPRTINLFAIGGEVEVRAGLLYQKQPLTGPQVHIGLGDAPQISIARIVWPNGMAQSEGPDKMGLGQVPLDQRLLGSCPFLFTWDGEKMVFVTDCIWRSPLGLKINALQTAGVLQTEDWVKVRGDQLAPKNGGYELSITAELWETHYFDKVSLLTVDHPEGTEVFVDERFVPGEQPLLDVIATRTPRTFAQVRGWKGQDVSAIVSERDGRHVDDFGRTAYQGIAGDHWIELELPKDAPTGKPLYLIGFGWLHPTNTSINVALGQNKSMPPPSGLAIEAQDASGRWRKVREGLGFPAGKVKTVVLRVDDVFAPGAPRKLRLRTNLEIFWDQLRWAEGLPAGTARKAKAPLESAKLRYRGFSDVRAADASSPELPQDYAPLDGTAPRWRDLIGFHTRFGDVMPLLRGVDDRYVIMNAGDEMALRFKERPAPKTGWVRDFVFVGDGWEKDGNLNTTFGKTVLPLPAHDIKDYKTPPTTLENDPVYRRHPQDWVDYHTRYVTPQTFAEALAVK